MIIMNFQSIVLWSVMILTTAKFATSNDDKYKQQTAIEGTSYKMKCTDTDSDKRSSRPYIIWTVNGKPPQGPKYKLLMDGMVIRNVSREDALANYTCTLLDRFSIAPLQSETLKLRIRQRSGKLLENQAVVSKGRTLKIWGVLKQWKTLQCIMYSRPSPTFQWKNKITGAKIIDTPDLYKIVEADGTSNLTIFIRNDSMFAEYVCEGSNSLGNSSQNFMLVKGYKPTAPFIFPVFIAKDRVTFKVESQVDIIPSMNKGISIEPLPITSYVIQFKTVTAEDAMNSERDNNHLTLWLTISETDHVHEGVPFIVNHGGGTLQVKRLRENTTYLVRSAAMSDFSTAVRVTTEASSADASIKSQNNKDLQSKNDLLSPEDVNDRREHGRSTEEDSPKHHGNATNESVNSTSSCTSPRFKETVIITTSSTTLIEDISVIDNNNNSSIIKKRVEEDTTIDRVYLCSLNKK